MHALLVERGRPRCSRWGAGYSAGITNHLDAAEDLDALGGPAVEGGAQVPLAGEAGAGSPAYPWQAGIRPAPASAGSDEEDERDQHGGQEQD
ncbi:MAG: hypothetical protein ACREQ5_23640, partial [Candidatus Dormibacteria bacterium]